MSSYRLEDGSTGTPAQKIDELRVKLMELRGAAIQVVERWESGDLAEAVRNLNKQLNEL